MTSPSNKKLQYALLGVLAGCVLMAYSNSFSGVFVFDDLFWIVEYQPVRILWSPLAATENSPRPFGQYTFAINYAMHGLDVWGYHATNLAIHLGSALMLFGIVRRTLSLPSISESLRSQSIWLAFAITSLWAVHPLQTQAVTYIIQRFESLMGLFFLSSIYCLIRSQESEHESTLVGGFGALFGFGMCTKEVTIALPLLALWYDRAFLQDSWRALWKRHRFYHLAMIATSFLLLWTMTRNTDRYDQGGLVNVSSMTPLEYLQTQTHVIPYYVRLCFYPVGQSLDYGWPVVRNFDAAVLPGLAILTFVGLTIWAIFRAPKLSFLGGWFFLILAPTSSVVPIFDAAFEHRMYLPSIAVIVCSVLAMVAVGRSFNFLSLREKQRLAKGMLVVGILVLMLLTYQRNTVYHSEFGMWVNVIDENPANSRGWQIAMSKHETEEDLQTIQERIERFLPAGKQNKQIAANCYGALGDILKARWNFPAAIKAYEKALTYEPQGVGVSEQLASCYMIQGDLKTAEQLLFTAQEQHSHSERPPLMLGLLYRPQNPELALEYFQKALEKNHRSIEARINLAGALTATHRPNEALEILKTMTHHEETSEVYLIERGLAYLQLGEAQQAEQDFRKVLQLSPGNPEATFHLKRMGVLRE